MHWLHRVQQYVAVTEAEVRLVLSTAMLLVGGLVARQFQKTEVLPPEQPVLSATPIATSPIHKEARQEPLVLNLNLASAAELERLPGIGPALARRIVEYRSVHGRFRKYEEIEAVNGIGPKLAAKLRPHLRVDPATR